MHAGPFADGLSLSVLDTVPVADGQTSADAIAASMAQAELADQLGYSRYWFAEHHNLESVASSSPAVLIGTAAARTSQIRLGSGGVMLPNHAPFVVAEQFATLEALAPGRIDLGLGRSSGSDSIVASLLGTDGQVAVDFADHIATVSALLDPNGAEMRLRSGQIFRVSVTPRASGRPPIWVLGSSAHSAQIAGRLGLPYVFAHHFFGRGTQEALDTYRAHFRPSPHLDSPEAVVTANVVVDISEDDAHRAALPHLLQFARIQKGQPLPLFDTIEQAVRIADSVATPDHLHSIRSHWFVGDASQVMGRLEAFASELGVSELMLALAAGTGEGEDATRSYHREKTLSLLAATSFSATDSKFALTT